MINLTQILEQAKELEAKGKGPNKFAVAEGLYTSGIEIAQKTDDPLQAILLNHRGIARRMLGNYDGAFADYDAAQVVASDNADNEQEAFALVNKADIHRVRDNDAATAHKVLDEAIRVADRGSLMHAKAVDQRGLVYISQGRYIDAVATYKEALDLCENLFKNDSDNSDVVKRLGEVLHHLGVAYDRVEDPRLSAEAKTFQNRALETFTVLGDTTGMANAHSSFGKLSMREGNIDDAIIHYKKALEICKNTGYKRGVTSLSLNLADAHLAQATGYLNDYLAGVDKGSFTQHDLGVSKDKMRTVMERYATFSKLAGDLKILSS